ncbi:MAG: cyclase family protein [Pseudorhodoplanes sp.]|jgi:kynurenine formamidase|nr:cyclase family protein [Pseudorhodoplanes sp.]
MCVPGCEEAVRQALTRRGFFKNVTLGAAAAGFAATAIAPCEAQAATRKFTQVVDLTHTMSPDFPTFFGVPGVTLEKQFDIKKDGFNLNWWRIIEHAGTHLDAPIHFSENGATLEAIAADALVLPLVVVSVAAAAARNPDYQLSRADLQAWEKRHGKIPPRACIAMNSGWARYANDGAKYTGKDAAGVFHFPGFAPEAAQWLMKERNATAIAVDTLSLDHGPSKDFATHKQWLPSGRWGLENVANLDKVPAKGATLVAGVAKVQGATGGPARVMALV